MSNELANIIKTKGNAAPTEKKELLKNTNRAVVNVKLDRSMYREMRIYGLDNGLSNQDIMVKALALLLSQNK